MYDIFFINLMVENEVTGKVSGIKCKNKPKPNSIPLLAQEIATKHQLYLEDNQTKSL